MANAEQSYTPIIKELDNNYSYYCILFLSRPGKPKEKICSVIVNDLTFTRKYRDYNELSFTLSKNIKTYFSNDVAPFERTRHLVEQPAYSLVREGMIVDFRMYNSYTGGLSFEELYYINQPSIDDNGDKTISCIPCHQHLFEKTKLRGYDDTRKLLEYDGFNEDDGSPKIPKYEIKNTAGAIEEHTYNFNNYLEGGILNYILEYRLYDTWKVKYYDEKLNHLYDDMKAQLFSNIGGSDKDSYDFQAESYIEDTINEIYELWVESEKNLDDGYRTKLANIEDTLKTQVSTYGDYLYYSTQLTFQNKVTTTFEEMRDALRDFGDETTKGITIENAQRDPQYLINSLTKMENAMASFLSLIDYMLSFDMDNSIDTSNKKYNKAEKAVDTLNEYIQNLSTIYHNLLDNIYAKLLVFKNYPGVFTYRSLTFESDDLSSVFKQLEESYLCMFVFDNVNQEIYIYSRNSDYNERQSNFVITPDNYAISIDYSPNFSQVATRLYIKGKDDLSIGGVNPTGQNYIDDFSYFINASETENNLQMSEELREALTEQKNEVFDEKVFQTLNSYNDELSEIEDNYADFNTYCTQLLSALEDSANISSSTDDSTKKMQQSLLNDQVTKIYQLCKGFSTGNDTDIKEQVDTDSYSRIVTETQNQDWYASFDEDYSDIREKKLQFLVNIEILKLAIYNYQSPNILQNWFKNKRDENGNQKYDDSIYQELTNYIIETDLDVNYLYDDKQAYYYGRQWLEYNNKIPITVTIDSANLFNNNKYFFAWEKIEDIGSYVYLSSYKDKITLEKMRFMSYTYSLSSNSIQMTFSNEEEIKDALNLLTKNVLGYTLKLSNKIDQYLSTWEDYIDKRDELLLENQDINTEINTLKDGNGNIIANGTGIVLNPLEDNSILKTPSGLYVPDYSKKIDDIVQTSATEVSKQEVVAADNIEATSAFIDDLQVERIQTNIKNFICKPNLTTNGDTIMWSDDPRTWSATSTKDVRGYIKIEGITCQYIEAHLTKPLSYTKITIDDLQPLTVNGRQMYFTSVSGSQAFQYLTFTAPKTKYSDMNDTQAAMYVVYIRKTESEYVKKEDVFDWDSTNETYNIKTYYGTGDESGMGRYYFFKGENGGRLGYTSRTDGTEYGVGIKDDGCYQITGGVWTKMRPIAVVSSENNIPEDFPMGGIILIGDVQEGD